MVAQIIEFYPTNSFITARKRSLRRLCFYRCLSFILFTGGGVRGRGGRAWQGGACMAGGAGGRAWQGGHAWRGGAWQGGSCVVGGHAWFYSAVGGLRGFIRGGVHGFIWGACVVLFGGVHGFIRGGVCGFIRGGVRGFIWRGGVRVFFSFSGYNEIRSMSGRYASYWNAFLSY